MFQDVTTEILFLKKQNISEETFTFNLIIHILKVQEAFQMMIPHQQFEVNLKTALAHQDFLTGTFFLGLVHSYIALGHKLVRCWQHQVKGYGEGLYVSCQNLGQILKALIMLTVSLGSLETTNQLRFCITFG